MILCGNRPAHEPHEPRYHATTDAVRACFKGELFSCDAIVGLRGAHTGECEADAWFTDEGRTCARGHRFVIDPDDEDENEVAAYPDELRYIQPGPESLARIEETRLANAERIEAVAHAAFAGKE